QTRYFRYWAVKIGPFEYKLLVVRREPDSTQQDQTLAFAVIRYLQISYNDNRPFNWLDPEYRAVMLAEFAGDPDMSALAEAKGLSFYPDLVYIFAQALIEQGEIWPFQIKPGRDAEGERLEIHIRPAAFGITEPWELPPQQNDDSSAA
ncbi:MAG: hypothetical protein NZL92_12435, partial [Gloeomargarita sp. SKYG116]|nr:hypothetical protein [Gloeomargarita sp. SKYG116]MDW8402487.1 hypothetical protein [Gloeomargarita sp. SKYGB_i_bin116]